MCSDFFVFFSYQELVNFIVQNFEQKGFTYLWFFVKSFALMSIKLKNIFFIFLFKPLWIDNCYKSVTDKHHGSLQNNNV